MRKPIRHLYEFGPFRVDVKNGRLLRDGQAVPLKPKVFDTLLVLVENSGMVIGKDELMERLWPEVAVEENNLTQNISALRKVFGDDGQQYIETVPKRGYRFACEVKEIARDEEDHEIFSTDYTTGAVIERHRRDHIVIEEERPKALSSLGRMLAFRHANGRTLLLGLILVPLSAVTLVYLSKMLLQSVNLSSASVATEQKIKSIAVLPFKTLAPDNRDDYLGIGFTETIITRLSSFREIIVRPTSAVRKYADTHPDIASICQEQKVEALIEGSVQKQGNNLRVSAQLVDGRNGRLLWAGNFDETAEGVFRLQDSICRAVAERLSLEESRAQSQHHTDNFEAYQAYLKGRYHLYQFREDEFNLTIDYFNQAISLDNTYALAYAGIAEAYWYSADLKMPGNTALQKSKEYAQKALELDNNLAEAHLAMALVKVRYDWDWTGSEAEFSRALEIAPNNSYVRDWYGWYLAQMGRFDEAFAQLRQAQQLNPLSPEINTDMGNYFYCARQFEHAIEEQKKTLELEPDYWPAHSEMGWAYMQMGNYEQAIQSCKKAFDIAHHAPRLSALGFAYALSGNKDEARKILERLMRMSADQYVSPFDIALIHIGIGNKDLAFEWLKKAYEERSGWMIYLKNDPIFDSIRSDPRFGEMLRLVGLVF